MPPMSFNGIVTKAGFMNKTATVTVSRQIIHKLTGKVRPLVNIMSCGNWSQSSANWAKQKISSSWWTQWSVTCLTCLCFPIQFRQIPVLRQHDIVVIRNCPPLSAMKRFKLEKILKSPETEHDLARARRAKHGIASSELPQGSVLQAIKNSWWLQYHSPWDT